MTHDTADDESNTTDQQTDDLVRRLQRHCVELATTDPTADHSRLNASGSEPVKR